jgi:hypothetical protein
MRDVQRRASWEGMADAAAEPSPEEEVQLADQLTGLL